MVKIREFDETCSFVGLVEFNEVMELCNEPMPYNGQVIVSYLDSGWKEWVNYINHRGDIPRIFREKLSNGKYE